MEPRSSRRWFFLAAALLATVGGGIAPSKARATCGDGLRSLHQDTNGRHSQAIPDPIEAMPPSDHGSKPCDGPSCKRGSVPLVPAVPPVPPSVDDWSYLPAEPCVLQPVPGLQVTDWGCNLPARLASDIFHPPRISS